MPTRLYFSNNIETLARAFARELADRNDWFAPCAIIIPNPYLQKWLQMQIAHHYGIAMNLDFSFLNDGLWKTVDSIYDGQNKPSMIDQLDIQLMLHHIMVTLDTGNTTVKPITDYLYSPDGAVKKDYDHKIWQLSSRLSRYFIEYELYREDMIQDWMRGKLQLRSDLEAAQRYLYYELFKKDGCRDAVNSSLLTLPQYWNRVSPAAKARASGKLYLFGKSQLSPFHARMLYELGNVMDISLYQVNPCSEFWEDVTTPGEDRWQRIRSIRIEKLGEENSLSYDDDENPLLKIWGKTGRETIKLLSMLEDAGSAAMNFQSEWLVADNPLPADTCLGTVREQILKRTTRPTGKNEPGQDTSIQIARCPEIFREAEAVYNSILYNLEHDAALKMTDIAVMVPDMEAYGPVLHSIFSREPKRLSYSIIDSTAATDSLFAQGIGSIFQIASGSFTRTEIFGLVYNRCFLAAHNMNIDEAGAWLAWADALQVFRDFNKNNDIDPRRNRYTWEQALQRIRLGRIMNPSEADRNEAIFLDYKNIVPYADMYSGDQRLIDSFNSVLELLYARTGRLRDLDASGEVWAEIIEGLASDFLSVPEDRPEESAVRQKLFAEMRRLSSMDLPEETGPGVRYSLSFIKEFIANTLSTIPSTRGSYLTSGINISAFVPKRQVPFKIIYIMGMQEGAFPGIVDASTLNLMNYSRKIGDVSRPDANRYLFLETLLAAREKLYITYIYKDLQKDKGYYPNSVIGQFITYLKTHVISNEFIITEVPPSGNSERYLNPDPALLSCTDFIVSLTEGKYRPVNYTEQDLLILYRNVLTSGDGNKNESADIRKRISEKVPDFSVPVPEQKENNENIAISLRELSQFLVNPIESSLRWHLGIYDEDDEDRTLPEDGPFFTKYPYDYRFIHDVLNYYIHNGKTHDIQLYMRDYYEHASLMSITPDGVYGEIDYDNCSAMITERLDAEPGLSEFIESRKNSSLFQNITFGTNNIKIKPDLIYPALHFGRTELNRDLCVGLSGSLPCIWKDPGSGQCETLVITNSAKPSVVHVVQPFLFYMAAISGLVKDLDVFIGPGTFTIHVSHKGGVTPYRYRSSGDEARAYLNRLLADFLDETSFDILPLAIIAGQKVLAQHDMNDNPDKEAVNRYRELLIRLIDEDAEKELPAFRPMRILSLMEAEVPADAYIKVRDRMGMLLKPFSEGNAPS
jgi:exodeoxyribonuclease V gamma subunit